MVHCFQCGADLPDNLAFCLHCGAKLDDETATVVNPSTTVEPIPTGGSGIGKFILGSLLGAMLVILLLVIGAFVLFSMKSDRETVANMPANNAANASPSPSRSPTPRKPTPSPTVSVANDNTEPAVERQCHIVNPSGGSVNIRRDCDTRDCSADESTLYIEGETGETVIPTGRKPVTTGRFTWVQVKYGGEILWISSTRMVCD